MIITTGLFGCKKATDNTTCPHWAIYIPNSFTPNGNLVNDAFYPKMPQKPSNYEMRVYSNSGEQLFYTQDYAKGWNGTFINTIEPQGTYSYKISATDSCGINHTYSGNVYLAR